MTLSHWLHSFAPLLDRSIRTRLELKGVNTSDLHLDTARRYAYLRAYPDLADWALATGLDPNALHPPRPSHPTAPCPLCGCHWRADALASGRCRLCISLGK